MVITEEDMREIETKLGQVLLFLGDVAEKVREEIDLVNQLMDITDRVLIAYHNIAIKYVQGKVKGD
jgi:hypothetical protein